MKDEGLQRAERDGMGPGDANFGLGTGGEFSLT